MERKPDTTKAQALPSKNKKPKLGEPARDPAKNTPICKDKVLKLIPEFYGNMSRIADAIGCSRRTIKDMYDRHDDIKQAIDSAREKYVDDLEDSVWTTALSAESRDTTMRIFLLKTVGRHRGYDQGESKDVARQIASDAFKFIQDKAQEK